MLNPVMKLGFDYKGIKLNNKEPEIPKRKISSHIVKIK
jgi:hypothetical protein